MLPLEAFHLRKREGGELGLVGIYKKDKGSVAPIKLQMSAVVCVLQ